MANYSTLYIVSPIWQYTIKILSTQVHSLPYMAIYNQHFVDAGPQSPLYGNIQSTFCRLGSTVSPIWQYTINILATRVHSLPYMAIYNQHFVDAGPQSPLYGNIQSTFCRRGSTVSPIWQYTINILSTRVRSLPYMAIYNQYFGDAGPQFPLYGNIQSIFWRRRSTVSPIWKYKINILAMHVHSRVCCIIN